MYLTCSAKTGRMLYISSIFGCGTHRSPAGQCGVGIGCSDVPVSIQAHWKTLLLHSATILHCFPAGKDHTSMALLHPAPGQETASAQVSARLTHILNVFLMWSISFITIQDQHEESTNKTNWIKILPKSYPEWHCAISSLKNNSWLNSR